MAHFILPQHRAKYKFCGPAGQVPENARAAQRNIRCRNKKPPRYGTAELARFQLKMASSVVASNRWIFRVSSPTFTTSPVREPLPAATRAVRRISP